ncbi:ABC-2 type transport system permease protein [Alkalibacterium gilvum]|uniref:ABC-2 type transport system permease protein n=1 Tax=Alkalibacterium gilvum TaxID=1130080 RepID=A0A1H6U3M3_9LACT|nr:ABC transporter permease [Alkalibacterium gilvum]SEI86958.1 ABC-2 type transport system permease protein [Alkalibacterium gilvum]
MDKSLLIAKDVYRRNVKSLSFFGMVFIPIIMFLAITVFSYFVIRPQQVPTIGMISENQNITHYLQSNAKGFEVDSSIQNKKQAENKLIDGEITGYIEELETNNFLFISSKINNNLESNLQNSLNNYNLTSIAKENNLPENFISQVNNNLHFKTNLVTINNDKVSSENKQNNVAQFISVAMCILIFLFIMNYSAIIGHEISSEKGSRIMEVILSSTTATSHLVGKLLGILMMCLTQIAIYLSLGVVGLFFVKDNPIIQTVFNNITLSPNTQYVILINFLYFFFGVVTFSLLTSILSSLVSRTEDIAKVLQPITLIGMGGFYLGIILAQNNPNHIAIKATSYIPLLSNFIMPFRLANGVVNGTNITISILIYAIFTLILSIYTFKVYKNNILMYQDIDNILVTLFKSIKRNIDNKKLKPEYN